MAPMGQTFTQHPQATHSLCATTAFLFLRLPVMSIPPRVNMDIMIGRTGVFFRDEITENACRGCRQASACRKSPAAPAFPAKTRFPCAFSTAGETRKETLLRKASESTAHVAGFGIQLGGRGPPNLPEGFFDSLKTPAGIPAGVLGVIPWSSTARGGCSRHRPPQPFHCPVRR